ncbi:Sugar efflux transporter for intercellular exchange family protein [Theileria parva strain Muguga]|uniref:MtN3/RAG1IP protein, putative n=1 Tax=Theileria parva TaxID=5875 RepID=Q4N707_THEPA|nr:uncharacterized protein TpMuguga_01g01013 [Theileria parva strain Muguga]EAN34251.1 Sugar efflux transporter for intercellular exchange family protein [Theileria parva strain Muguga]|eukprot:XP_766534.1 hypothetical protein [Theileria parva strain Muguga]
MLIGVVLVIIRIIIADNVNVGDPKSDKVTTADTQIIQIKLNDNSTNLTTNTNETKGVQVEGINDKAPPPAAEPTASTPSGTETIATITLNIPNTEAKTIEIKNVDTKNTQAPQTQSVPAQQETVPPDQQEVSETFFNKILKFITSDFRFLVKFGAVLSSALTQMIPLNLILTIRKNNSTRNLKCLNFVTSAVSSLSWSLYGILSKNVILIISNFPGAIINLIGIWMFVKYCSDQNEKFILSVSSKISFALCVILLVLFFILTSTTFLTVVGLIGGSLLAMSYLSPLFSFKEILESRNTSTMPTEISLGNFISSFFMFCYGFIIWDMLVIAPSFLGVISGLIQLTLLFLFPHSDRIIISEVEILEQPNNFRSMLAMDQDV